ncbi:MAG: hypothetical protein AVDCRST_MAG25-1807, partial [uncultured Rubrobacteraceae bacterium]
GIRPGRPRGFRRDYFGARWGRQEPYDGRGAQPDRGLAPQAGGLRGSGTAAYRRRSRQAPRQPDLQRRRRRGGWRDPRGSRRAGPRRRLDRCGPPRLRQARNPGGYPLRRGTPPRRFL